jgi:hypothetical protein
MEKLLRSEVHFCDCLEVGIQERAGGFKLAKHKCLPRHWD